MKTIFYFLILASFASKIVFSQPLNLSVTQVAGTCSSNARINAFASGGSSPYQYRLTAGASGSTYPSTWQSGINFSGLKAGTYTVQVLDNIGATVSKDIIVTTTYVSLSINSVNNTANHCPLSPDGTITITAGNGRLPYSYRLLQGATEIRPAQSTNKFTALPDGNYSAEITDACGEIRTYPTSVLLADFKWMDVKPYDNGFVTAGSGRNYAAAPFDPTKLSNIYDGPIQFTCDSIAFRILNTLAYNGNELSARNFYRRVYIKDLSSGNTIWDNVYKPSDWPGGYSSPSVHLKINTSYRFYFDDLCNDIDSADRNYNYANTDNYYAVSTPQKTCSGYDMVLNLPTDWNTKNRYNSPYDTITIIGSTLAGDTAIGKYITENYPDVVLSQQLILPGITPGNTYTLQIKTLCSTYTKTVYINSPPALKVVASVNNIACKVNTASINLVISNYTVVAGKMMKYRINSGPASFTDIRGNTFTISYPIIDSVGVSGGFTLRNFPAGNYSMDFWDACGNTVPTIAITITNADVLKISGALTANQQCPGASSITYSNLFNQRFSGSLVILKKNGAGNYGATGIVSYNSSNLPPVYTFSSLADGDYRIIILPAALSKTYASPIPSNTCDTLFKQDISLKYQNPVVDTASGYVCTAGGNDGKITLFGDKGARPYQFQQIDATGNSLSPYQADSAFTGLAKGLYNFRIKDNCGNATTYSYQIDTLNQLTIAPSTLCPGVGQPLTLTADTVYQASYLWTFTPSYGGVTKTVSDSRVFQRSSLTAADFGINTLTYTLPGCATAVSTSIMVNNCSVILPVKLIYFEVKNNTSCGANITWATSDEQNIHHFEIQQSTDSDNWIIAATFNPVHNNTTEINTYSFQTTALLPGKTFYRLKISDVDGYYIYSNTSFIYNKCISKNILLYPNPAKDKLSINLKGYAGIIKGKLYNASGQLVTERLFTAGTNVVTVSGFANGIYNLIIKTDGPGNEQRSLKVIIYH